jgi:hypothetical protein
MNDRALGASSGRLVSKLSGLVRENHHRLVPLRDGTHIERGKRLGKS